MEIKPIQPIIRIFKHLTRRFTHLCQRIHKQANLFPDRNREFGLMVAIISLIDGCVPPEKSKIYIRTIQNKVNSEMNSYNNNFNTNFYTSEMREATSSNIIPVWCCWWQGADNMPDIVRMCQKSLLNNLPREKVELRLITENNYKDYVQLPEYIEDKVKDGRITITSLSDIIRFKLLEKFGGYWVDATVFFTGQIPDQYFTANLYCQKMTNNISYIRREACGGKWCGFSISGQKGHPLFQYMSGAFDEWWKKHNLQIDYVLIDYLLESGYQNNEYIRSEIDAISDNNEDIFELYKILNEPFSIELLNSGLGRNTLHKLTYKETYNRYTEDGKLTIYGYLWNKTFDTRIEW